MLMYNPKLRSSAAEALMDPWIQNNTHTTPLNKKIFSNLSAFYGDNRFRHAILTFMASRMTTKEDRDELMNAFSALDTDGNGVLSRAELIAGYKKTYPDYSSKKLIKMVDGLMSQVDVNKEGKNFFNF